MIENLSTNINYLIQKSQITAHKLAQESGASLDGLRALIYEAKEPPLSDLLLLAKYYRCSLDRLVYQDLSLLSKIDLTKIKMLALDIDGVLTDGGMIYSESGDEHKIFHTKDGMAIMKAIQSGLVVAFISSGFKKEIIERRAELLGVSYVYVGRDKKVDIMDYWLQENGWSYENLAYVGDDVNDAAIMRQAAISACPQDSSKDIKRIATIHLSQAGGKACVREFIEDWLQIPML